MTAVAVSVKRTAQISRAFIRMGYINTVSYPLAFIMTELSGAVPAFTFLFISRMIDRNTPSVAGDYYTYVMIGIVSVRMLSAGMQGFISELQSAINQGRLEMLLVEPLRWRLLPFGMAQWHIVLAVISGTIILLVSAAMGANYLISGLPLAILIIALGILASLGVGILDASIKILAKKADPILTLYTLAASIFSGALFPIQLLPSWLTPLSWAIPHTYVIYALRSVLMPGAETLPGPSTGAAILGLALFTAVAIPVGLWLFGRSLEYGRKLGVLGAY